MKNKFICNYFAGILGLGFMLLPTAHSLFVSFDKAFKINPVSAMRFHGSTYFNCKNRMLIKINNQSGAASMSYTYTIEGKTINAISVEFATYKRKNVGEFDVLFMIGNEKFERKINAASLKDNNELVFFTDIGVPYSGEIRLTISNPTNTPDNTVSLWACKDGDEVKPIVKIYHSYPS